jgi:arylsulfatase A-like enzyme
VPGYTTDILTDLALDWLREQADDAESEPFFLVLSHKAVHAEFEPAERHAGRYADEPIPYPVTMPRTQANVEGQPRWVREQRYGWHGVDYAYHGQFDFDTFYRRYAETLLALDEGVGRVLDWVRGSRFAGNTLVLYLSDNGFSMGEHGLIDKRHAYEESIRIPMISWGPGVVPQGVRRDEVVRNIDIAPTILDLAGVEPTTVVDGRSMLPVLRGEPMDSTVELLYEYYWEYAFPHTPTTFALRGDRFKYIFYQGIWDTQELFDLETDPLEQHNLIDIPAYQDTVVAMRGRMWAELERTNGLQIPLRSGNFQACERLLPY